MEVNLTVLNSKTRETENKKGSRRAGKAKTFATSQELYVQLSQDLCDVPGVVRAAEAVR